ncbi:MAG: hypothetical protein NPIRA04_29860 [Nitrospirales bacterium]|nr:MAG: hypothetical protein NPIRA04_29860 [Nitrospirales bacterium]
MGAGALMLVVSWPQVEAKDFFLEGVSRLHGYRYVSEGRRDPFGTIVERARPTMLPESVVITPSLSRTQWSLLGIISGVTGHHAMLQNSHGSRYLVSLGDILPNKHIRVARLTNTTVMLERLDNKNMAEVSKGRIQPKFLELTFKNSR